MPKVAVAAAALGRFGFALPRREPGEERFLPIYLWKEE
jgi:hypothetical protein